MNYEEELLEPLKYYKELDYKLEENATALFDELTQKSGIDVGENKATCDEYYLLLAQHNALTKKTNKSKTLRVFLIVCIVLFFLVGAILIGVSVAKKDLLPILLPIGIVLILGGVALIILIVKVINKSVSRLETELNKIRDNYLKKKDLAYEQMATLNSLYDWNMTSSLIEKSVPIIHMDKNFSVERCDHLATSYGWKMRTPDNVSTVFTQSGTIIGNPFVYERDFVQMMFDKTYTGTLVISWTTTTRDSKGNLRVIHHTQTLVATVVKPAATFFLDTALIYGNKAAPKLSFSRKKSEANSLSDAKIEKNAEAYDKKLAKMQKDKIASNFTPLANSKFEYLFGALNRDNEVEFRLLFTPLAQKNMISLITSKQPYGDDFDFSKKKMINIIHSDHAQSLNFDGNPYHFQNFDYELARKDFIAYNRNAFKGIFYDFLPLLSIPLYQQHKDYDPKETTGYNGSVTEYEAEVLANFMEVATFKPDNCDTKHIIKAKLMTAKGPVNIFEITSHGFKMVSHVELVPKLGGDGNMHAVPVTWYEYIPVEKTFSTCVINVGGTRQDYLANKQKVQEFISIYSMSSDIIYQRGLLSFPLNEGVSSIEANALIKLFSHKED